MYQVKVFFFLLFSGNLAAQTTESGNIFTEISNIISNMPGDSGNDYADPTSGQMTTWNGIIADLFAANYSTAATSAGTLNYDLIEYTDTGQSPSVVYYLLRNNASNYWGTYVFNPNYCREIAIQSPHPKKDFNTGKQGIHVFRETEAAFFQMSGTHRCNHSNFSGCSGTTSVCSGSSQSYRISDLAHTVSTIFQQTTKSLQGEISGIHFIQLHGFTKLSTDPYVILSNGTDQTPSGTDYLADFKDNLFAEDNTLTFKIAHIDSWTRLVGFTNTQGRLINASTNHCTSAATSTTGEFFHIEQEKTKLRDDITGWNKVANAVAVTFTCTPLPVELIAFFTKIENEKVLISWSTASEINNDFFTIERSKNGIDWQFLETIPGAGNSFSQIDYQSVDTEPLPENSFYRLVQTDFDGSKSFSKVISVFHKSNLNRISIFPNPAQHKLNISLPSDEASNILIINNLGQIVLQKSFSKTEEIKLNLNEFRSGFYFLKIDQNRFSQKIKLILNR